jgi:peptidoglycan/LPS O-acetylase OafA/YrhL
VAAGAFVVLAGLRVAAGPSAFAAVPRWPGPTILAINALWLGLVGYVACRAGSRGLAPLRSRPLARLGEISYGLYLYHFPILLLAGDLARRAGFRDLNVWLKIPTLALCLGVAWASWVVLERPILRLKDRFPYRDGREGTGPAGPHPRVASPVDPREIPSHPAVGPGTCFSGSRSGIPKSQVPPPA